MITTTCGIALLTIALNWCDATKSTSLQEREAIETPYMSNRQLIAREKAIYKVKVYNLAVSLYFEERSSRTSDECIAAIGYVILNRVHSRHFPDTIQGVIWQPYQFSFTHDLKPEIMHNKVAEKRALQIADKVLKFEIDNKVGDATHYLNKTISRATWWKSMKSRGKCGSHWFYKETR